ncbi:MAG: sigma-70 family RNA polymerase sigma factor [Chitinophagaceae bacterium]|nr:MAG: sigma-70 family RNA polymerase sigma factor [Chitinophagaceae bacterium]
MQEWSNPYFRINLMCSMPFEDISKLKEGDHQVFKTLYEHWNPRVYYYFLKKTNSEDFSKELTQLVFIKLWNYRASLSSDLSIDQQLFQKARLIFIDWLRTQATQRKHFVSDPGTVDEPAIDSVGPGFEAGQNMEYSINRLPPKRRKVFELKHIHGYSYKEIAEHLGITVKTVDNHLLKAASQLKKVFNL